MLKEVHMAVCLHLSVVGTIKAMRMRETFQQIYQAPDMQTFRHLLQKWYHWVSQCSLHPSNGTTPKQENFDSVVLTQKGLLISFDKYQVAPGSEGIVKILIPFKDLSEFLSPKIKELFQ
jgi:hypothetical protein